MQSVEITPLGPTPLRQKKMPHLIFGPDQYAAFKKIASLRFCHEVGIIGNLRKPR
jgi:hypothetical protein